MGVNLISLLKAYLVIYLAVFVVSVVLVVHCAHLDGLLNGTLVRNDSGIVIT